MSSNDIHNQDFDKLEENLGSNLSIGSNPKLDDPEQQEFEHVNKPTSSLAPGQKLQFDQLQANKEDELNGTKRTDIIETSLQIALEKNNRTDEEAWTIYGQIKDFKFFNQVLQDKNEPESILRIVKALKYRKIKAGRPVFVEGDPANGNLYVLYSGEIHVMAKASDIPIDVELGLSPAPKKLASKVTFNSHNSHTMKSIVMPNAFGTTGSLGDEEELNYSIQKKMRPAKPSRSKKITTLQTMQKFDTTLDGAPSTVLESPRLHSPGHNKDDTRILNETTLTPREQLIRKLKREKSFIGKDKEPEKESLPYGNYKDKLVRGDDFGSHYYAGPDVKMEYTALADTDCELLVLAAATFNTLKNEFNKKVKKILDLILAHLPGLEPNPAKNLVKNYFSLFEQREFYFGNHVANEGEKGDRFFIIYGGSCEVYRTIKIEEAESLNIADSKIKKTFFSQSYTVKEKIPLTILKDGMLAGEEILFEDHSCYNYSIQVVSDSCKLVAIKKDKFNIRFPKEVVRQIKEAYEEKKEYKNELLMQALAKRDIESITGNIDDHFLLVKRNPPQDFSAGISKINSTPPTYASYRKMMADNVESDEIVMIGGESSPTAFPKSSKQKRNSLLEPDEIHLKQKMLNFSRANLMPAKEKDRESPKAGYLGYPAERKSPENKLPYLAQLGASEKFLTTEAHENPHNVDYIKKAKVTLGYQDINDVYKNISEKLNLAEEYNLLKVNVNHAEYYKWDFGKHYKFEEKWLANAKSQIGRPQAKSIGNSPLNGNGYFLGNPDFVGSASPVNKLHSLLKELELEKCVPSRTTTNRSPTYKDSFDQSKYQIHTPNVESEANSVMITLQPTQPQQIPTTTANMTKKFEPSFLKDFVVKKKDRREINKSAEGINFMKLDSPKKSKLRTKGSNISSMVRLHQPVQGDQEMFGLVPEKVMSDEVVEIRKKSILILKAVPTPALPVLRGNQGKSHSKSKTIKY